jgi:hypothetical protein
MVQCEVEGTYWGFGKVLVDQKERKEKKWGAKRPAI